MFVSHPVCDILLQHLEQTKIPAIFKEGVYFQALIVIVGETFISYL